MRSLDVLRQKVDRLANAEGPRPCRCILTYVHGDEPPADDPGMCCPICGLTRADKHFIIEEVVVDERGEVIEAARNAGV